jgi:hypothetical protein
MGNLLEFIKKLQSEGRFHNLDEAALKQGVVLKILSLSDWDPFDLDEIQPECNIEGGKIDFSLKQNDPNRVFLVVRKGSDLSKPQEELLNHSVQGNARMAVLTNGFTWWFYLPLLQGSADEKKFLSLDMNGQKGEEISEKFLQFLSKGNVTSGKSLKLAEEIYHTRQRAFLVKEFLPKAWEKIMKEPEKWLTEPLAEVTKNLCGYKPDMDILREFIRSRGEMKVEALPVSKPKPPVAPVKGKPTIQGEDYAGKSLTAFIFKEKRYEAKSWQAILVRVCETIFSQYKGDLDVLFTISGRGKEYFSRNPYEFLNCEKIPGTSIYVDVGLKAKEVVDLAYRIILLFGYKESDLVLEVK